MARLTEPTDTSYIINEVDDGELEHHNSDVALEAKKGPVTSTYLDHKIEIPDADSVCITHYDKSAIQGTSADDFLDGFYCRQSLASGSYGCLQDQAFL